METRIEKNLGGHDIFVNNLFIMWVTGSKRNAKKELKKYIESL